MGNTAQLEQLVAGIGRAGIRNVHFRDTEHRIDDDLNAFISEDVVRAMRAGGFSNVVMESPVAQNNATNDPLRSFLNDNGMQLYYPDARFAAFEATVRETNPELVGIYRANTNTILQLAQIYQNRTPSIAQLQERFQSPPDRATLERIRSVLPALWSDIINEDLNAQTTDNIRNRFPNDAEGRVFFYGAGHTDGSVPTLSRPRTDLDTAFPGYNIAVLNDRTQRSMAIDGPDDPEFIFYLNESGDQQIEDLRSDEEKRLHPLSQLLSGGQLALRSTPDTPVRVAATEPERPPATSTASTDVITAGPEAGTEEGNGLQNIPWGGVIGAAIGAWLTSAMGGEGIGRYIAMAIGGLIGWLMGGAIGQNMGNHDAPAASATAITPEAPAASAAASLANANALAFSTVNSVGASYPSEHVENGNIPETPPVVTLLPISDIISPTIH